MNRSSVKLLLAAGTLGLILTVAFVVQQPLWAGQPARPAEATALAPEGVGWPGVLVALGFAAAWTLPFRPYVLAQRAAQAVSVPVLLALTAALAGLALLIFPAFGSDLFVYVAYERLWTVYGENPLLAQPISHPQDWAFQFVFLPYQPNPYGPVFALLTWPIARLAGTSVAAQVAGYKVLALAGYVLCCGIIWRSTEPHRRQQALVLFAWSPLVLFETLGKAHNDVLLAVAAVAAVAAVRARGWPAAVTAALGGLVKLNGLAIMPGILSGVVRREGLRSLLVSLGSAALLCVAAYAPFWQGPQTLLPVLAQTSRVVWSPGSLLVDLGISQAVVRLGLAAVWLVCGLFIVARVRSTADSACALLLATLLLLTTAFFAHYLVPAIALGALSTSSQLQRLLLALSVGAMAAYAVEVLGIAFGPAWLGSVGFQALGSVVLLLPACLAMVPCAQVRARRTSSGPG